MWHRLGFISPQQRAYLRSHPLAFWFSLGIAVTVTVAIVDPSTVQETAITLVLPDWLETIFRWSYLVGGYMATIGLLFAKPRIEAAGMALLASGLLVQLATIMYLSPELGWPSAPFLLTLAIGTGSRAYYLATSRVYGAVYDDHLADAVRESQERSNA